MAASLTWLYNIARDHHPKLSVITQKVQTSYTDWRADARSFLYDAREALKGFVDACNGLENMPKDQLVTAALSFLVAVALAISIVRRIINKAQHKKLYGENEFPPFAPGNATETISAFTTSDLPCFFKRSAEAVGPIFRLNLPIAKKSMFVAVGDVELAKEMLQDSKTIKPEALYDPIKSIAGGPNILTSEGPLWKVSRSGIVPAFLKSHLDRMHKVCEWYTEAWIRNKLEVLSRSGEEFDLGAEISALTVSIVCDAAFEYKIKEKEAKHLKDEFDIAMREFARDGARNPLRSKLGFLYPSVRRAKLARTNVQAIAILYNQVREAAIVSRSILGFYDAFHKKKE